MPSRQQVRPQNSTPSSLSLKLDCVGAACNAASGLRRMRLPSATCSARATCRPCRTASTVASEKPSVSATSPSAGKGSAHSVSKSSRRARSGCLRARQPANAFADVQPRSARVRLNHRCGATRLEFLVGAALERGPHGLRVAHEVQDPHVEPGDRLQRRGAASHEASVLEHPRRRVPGQQRRCRS